MRFAIRAIFALSFTFFSSAYAQLVVASSAPGGTILCSGSVTDTTGAALAHAAVSLTQAGEAPLTTRTDNAGRFGLQVTKPAIGWTLTVTAPGFQEYAVPFDASLPAPLTIRLQVEAQSEQIEVQSVGGGNIEPTETQLGSAWFVHRSHDVALFFTTSARWPAASVDVTLKGCSVILP